jgi:phosphatidylglycerophosphate synthase
VLRTGPKGDALLGGERTVIVVATDVGADARVGGLALATRAVLAVAGQGFTRVAVLAAGRPSWLAQPLERRGVRATWLPDAPAAARLVAGEGARGDGVVVLAGNVLIDREAVAGLRAAAPGVLYGPDGHAAIGAVCPPGATSTEIAEGLSAARGLALPPAEPGGRASPAGTRLERGLVVPLAIAGSPAALEHRLLATLACRTAIGDSYLAAVIDRRLSRPVTRLLLRTRLSPSHITLAGVGLGVLGAVGLSTTSYVARLVGVLLLVASIVLDCVDGEVARARLEESAAGARLDVLGDYVVHLAAFSGLVVGLLRQGVSSGVAWAALALVAGVAAAMAVMHRLFVRPALREGGDLHWPGGATTGRGTPGATLAEKLASRDYTYLLFVLALAGRLEWFVYAAAAGSWAFIAGVLGHRLIALPSRGRAAPLS